MAKVKVYEGEPFEKALRRFRRQCKEEGIISDIRKREYHVKRSELRRRKVLKAIRRLRKVTERKRFFR
ncbi:MAG TPA: 30S ribosomal protein S21 [Candidatus Latescibacteria bacterium]|nr:30S ribosomal protein S21 [Candidatus Latescibacterota bacterium]